MTDLLAPLADLLKLACLQGPAGQQETLPDFLALSAETAARSLGASEAFLALLDEEDHVFISTTRNATCRPALLAAGAGLPVEVPSDTLVARWNQVLPELHGDLWPLAAGSEFVGLLGVVGGEVRPADGALAGLMLGVAIENFRIYHEARWHLSRQGLLRDIGRLLATDGPLEERFLAFLRRLHLLPGVDACALTLLDPEDPGRRRMVCHLNSLTVNLGSDVERAVQRQAAPIHLERLDNGHPSHLGSWLGLPLIRRETVIGVLGVGSLTPSAFTTQDIEFFMAVSEHTALSLENAWLLDATQKQVEELTFVAAVSRVLREEKSLEDVLQRALEQCIKTLEGDEGWILRLAPPPERTLGFSEDPRRDYPELNLPGTSPRLILLPLSSDRGMVAALVVAHHRLGPLTDSQRRLLATLTSTAENAIGRATAFEEMQARMREEAASRAKSEFLAIMTHQLRTPLTAILGFTELLADNIFGDTNPTQQEYLQEVLRSAHHLLTLINDVLDLAKVDAGKIELSVGPVEARALVEDVVHSLLPLARRKRIAIRIGVDEVPVVPADGRRLKQILYNLLGNAIKFTDEGGVTLSVLAEPGWARFEVRDTGIGIPLQEQEEIFKPFAQATRPMGKNYEGTGLGLSLSRRLAELHGGSLSVVSEPGRGSTFSVRLPLGEPS